MISVIVPVLNSEKYIDRCISSILEQTHQDIELLLMVGISSDSSIEKCLEWQRKDKRIIVVSRNDNSLGDARNYALPIARGEYIAYVDADDWIENNFLEKLVTPLIDNDDIDITVCGYKECAGSNVYSEVLPNGSGLYNSDFSIYLKLVQINSVWSKMYRRNWLIKNKIKMFDGQCEDVAMHLMVASATRYICLLKESLYCYNISNEDSLSKVPLKSRVDFIRSIEYVMPFLQKCGVLKKFRLTIRQYACSWIQSGIYDTDFNPEMVNKGKSFIDKYFPDCLPYMQFRADTFFYDNRRPVVIFGSGRDAVRLLKQKPNDLIINYIVDNNKERVGQHLKGVPIKSFVELQKEDKNIPIIIATRSARYDILEQLHSAGFNNLHYLESVLTSSQLRTYVNRVI